MAKDEFTAGEAEMRFRFTRDQAPRVTKVLRENQRPWPLTHLAASRRLVFGSVNQPQGAGLICRHSSDVSSQLSTYNAFSPIRPVTQ